MRGRYIDYCIDEACAVAGEAKDARRIEQTTTDIPVRRVGGRFVGTFHRET